jgi:uncharacterized glyoxalase superfamily protein PhnB
MSKPIVLGNISPMIPAGSDVAGAIAFYEEQLGFTTIYTEGNPITLEWTTFRIQVENIEQLYEEFQAKGGAMFHPNGQLQIQPWGAKEFVVLDIVGVCITFYETIL